MTSTIMHNLRVERKLSGPAQKLARVLRAMFSFCRVNQGSNCLAPIINDIVCRDTLTLKTAMQYKNVLIMLI